MITKKIIFQYLFLLVLIFILSIEKIKLSWEIATLHNNFENLQIEYDALKDLNLKLTTQFYICLLYTSPSPRDREKSRMPSSA